MGGGGGGGQANNGVATAGGNGGGIILIKANTIATSTTCGSSIRMSANGVDAGNSGNDGAGGGGAAGTIVIEANNFAINAACPLTVRTNAGDGGNIGNGAAHGGGGGGGQGAIIYSIAVPTLNITNQSNNGTAGDDDSGGTTNATNGAGTNGSGVITSGSGPLPIELVYFTGELLDTKVKLSWQTATERNNYLFDVERSADGENFKSIGTISGSGTRSKTMNYELMDYFPLAGLNYYRLKQIDFDGSYAYSSLIVKSFEKEIEISLYPNPLGINELLSIVTKSSALETMSISIYEISGKVVYSKQILSENTEFETKITTEDLQLTSGVFFVKVESGFISVFKKLIVR